MKTSSEEFLKSSNVAEEDTWSTFKKFYAIVELDPEAGKTSNSCKIGDLEGRLIEWMRSKKEIWRKRGVICPRIATGELILSNSLLIDYIQVLLIWIWC